MLAILVAGALTLSGPAALVIALRYGRRLRVIERELARYLPVAVPHRAAEVPMAVPPPEAVEASPPSSEPVTSPPAVTPATGTASLELRIGQRVLGWIAVVVLLFATAFFVRYAFENQWVGPLGRVTIGVAAGLVLAVRGRSDARRGWVAFSQMLNAGGIILLYLSTYSAFGFYHLLPQRTAGIFLLALVIEAAWLADRYRAPAIALMSIIGALLTPLLMHAEHDQYQSLFIYLTAINLGVIVLLARHAWRGIGIVALVGTQALFWLWYDENMHPDKLAWAVGFQAAVSAIYLAHPMIIQWRSRPRVMFEDALRLILIAVFCAAAMWTLLADDYRPWMGALSIGAATLYTAIAQQSWSAKGRDRRLVLAAAATALAFLAVAIALEAKAPWTPLGWAAEASALWWFGLRVRIRPLRLLAVAFALIAIWSIVQINFDHEVRPRLLLNRYALSSLAATSCFVLAVVAGRTRIRRLPQHEIAGVGAVVIACIALVWFVVSTDLYGYVLTVYGTEVEYGDAYRLAQMALSAWWAVYAGAVLGLGFLERLALLRWTALALFAVTIAKVFLLDMSGLDQLYRIVAFFVLAALLGAAAWAYQRLQARVIA
ncbi:MAG TPA: DUF2339 domain-containing protein [Pirellulales bacterium]|nr:DUF2339 domain-containing protein [Pirellulales bacterium]